MWSIEAEKPARSRVEVEPRGIGKSTGAELAVVAVAARKTRRFALYVSNTQDQADEHVLSIAERLESKTIDQYYPALGRRHLGKFGQSKGWSHQKLWTDDGFAVVALGLDKASRGIKLLDARPDIIVFDDIDDAEDSRQMVEKKKRHIARKILPAGDLSCATGVFVQNLVHKDSVCAQLCDGRADFMADRYVAGPYKLMTGFDCERETDGPGWLITQGEPVSPVISKEECQQLLTKLGRDGFLIECQQEVHIISGEKSFREYDEIYHVITWEEFADFFGAIARDSNGRPRIPALWKKERGLDWGTTSEHPSACIFSARPRKVDPLSDCVFTFGEIIRPRWPSTDPHSEVEMVSPGRVARAIKSFQREHMIQESEIKGVMSHEASAALSTFLVDLPEEERVFFRKWKARKGSGVPQIQEVLSIDRKRKHPFRVDPKTGVPLMGRPRHYIVSAKEQGELYYDREGNLKVRQPTDERGLARLRAEIPEFDEHATGAAKRFDDACDGWRGEAAGFFVEAAESTKEEKWEERLQPEIRHSSIIEIPDEKQQQAAIQSRELHLRRFRAEEDKEAERARNLTVPRVRFRK